MIYLTHISISLLLNIVWIKNHNYIYIYDYSDNIKLNEAWVKIQAGERISHCEAFQYLSLKCIPILYDCEIWLKLLYVHVLCFQKTNK